MNIHENDAPTDTRSKMGKARFGGGRIPALAIAIPLGLVVSTAIGAAIFALNIAGTDRLIGGLIFGIMTLGPAIALSYAAVVDRNSIRGALERPEESIEQVWYEKASSSAFHDVLIVAGVALFALAFIPSVTIDARLVLAAVIVVAALSTAIRYFALRKQG